MQIKELLCFGARPGIGNQALVVEGFEPDSGARQAFATERNKPACVFLDGDVVDYYYPHTRSPLCLHATLAAGHVLFERHGNAPRRLSTSMRGQLLELEHRDRMVFVGLQRQPVPDVSAPDLLGLGLPGVVASVGSPKLLVDVGNRAALYALQPDLEAITAWGKQHGVNGCYAYCMLDDGRIEGRNFNHLVPSMEDSATGVAAGALTVLLGRSLTVLQGAAVGKECEIHTQLRGESIFVGGATEMHGGHGVPTLRKTDTD
jgi:PhzF family phenazine biosynthesis protein